MNSDDVQASGMALESFGALPIYPFSALHGQAALQLALQLIAVDPRIGGVLIEGARGSAKTTSARALTDILPDGRFINLPLGASEEKLVGSLDLEKVLQHGQTQFQPGLLAKAHRGVLYVDEINLLSDALVDLLLDVCGSGINRIERDGVSHQHAADIVLLGTMNPEEGELRPQLLDRFGLYVCVDSGIDTEMRKRIVRSRLAFDDNPQAFVAQYADKQQALTSQIVQARALLPSISFTEDQHNQVAMLCDEACVDGVRADLVMLRASRAMAALQGRHTIVPEDIDSVAELVLAHRRKLTRSEPNAGSSKASDSQEQPKHSSDTDREQDGGSANSHDEASIETAEREDERTDGSTLASQHQQSTSTDGASQDHSSQPMGSDVENDRSGAERPNGAANASESEKRWGAMPAQPVPIMAATQMGAPLAKKS